MSRGRKAKTPVSPSPVSPAPVSPAATFPSAATPADVRTSSPRRRLWFLAIAFIVLGTAGFGAWRFSVANLRAVERSDALALAFDQRPEAGEKLKACLAREPGDLRVLETLVVWSLRGRAPFAEVEPYLDRLCQLKPADPAAWRIRADARIRNGHVAEGMADGLKALELDRNDTGMRTLVASAAIETGEPEIAIRTLVPLFDAPAAPPEDAKSMFVHALLLAGDAKQAERVLESYFPASRTDGESRLLRGLVLQARGKHREAASTLRAAADHSPEHRFAALAALAKSLMADSDEAGARKVLAELNELQARDRAIRDAIQLSGNLDAQIRAAEAYLAEGKAGDAVGVLERAVSKLGQSPAASAVLVRAYRQLGRDDLARKWEQSKGP